MKPNNNESNQSKVVTATAGGAILGTSIAGWIGAIIVGIIVAVIILAVLKKNGGKESE